MRAHKTTVLRIHFLSILGTLAMLQIEKSMTFLFSIYGYFAKHNHHCYCINIHYVIYGIIKSDLFRYPVETVNSKRDAKKKGA